jgi:hypothetical protein
VWEFFINICATRQSTGYGLLPVTYREILALVNLQGLCYTEDIEELVFFIPRMDAEYLEFHAEQQRKKTPKKKGVK